MDLLHSVVLLLALVAGGLSGACGLVVRRARRRAGLQRAATGGGIIALVLGAASAGMHFASGHGPDSAEAMGALAFARAHPAYLLVGLLAAAGLWTVRGGSSVAP